jgi:hypothetical protein
MVRFSASTRQLHLNANHLETGMLRIIVALTLLSFLPKTSYALCIGQWAEQQVLFEDNFTSSSGNWERVDGVKIGAGRMDLTLGTDSTSLTVLNKRLSVRDGDFCVRFKLPEPDADNGVSGSLVFWAQDQDNEFTVDVWSNGDMRLGRSTNGSWTELLSMDDDTRALKGPDDTTELRVVTGNGRVEIFLNGALVKSADIQTPGDNPRFGIYAEMDKESETPKHFQFTYFNVLRAPTSVGRSGHP